MNKNKLLAVAFSLCLGLSAIAGNAMKVTINGETVQNELARMTFDGDNVVLQFTDNTTLSSDMATVVLTMEEITDTGFATDIKSIQAYSLKGLVNGQISISNLAEKTPIYIYSANGARVKSTVALKGETVIDVNDLQKGVYMMRAGQQIVKFVKR